MDKPPCSEPNCFKPVKSRGMCHTHYMAWYTRNRPGICSIEGCDRAPYGRSGLCAMHYQRRRTLGDPGEAAPRFMQGVTVEERFWAKVNRNGSLPAHRPELGCCYEWTAHLNDDGYGMLEYEGRSLGAHKIAYMFATGVLLRGREPQIDHLCRNRKCVRASHLEAVTQLENQRRGKKAQQTHCLRGHLLEGANLKPRKDGTRQCRECVNIGRRERYKSSPTKENL